MALSVSRDTNRGAEPTIEVGFGLRILGNTGSVGWLMASSDNLSYPHPLLTVTYDDATASTPTSWGTIKSRYR